MWSSQLVANFDLFICCLLSDQISIRGQWKPLSQWVPTTTTMSFPNMLSYPPPRSLGTFWATKNEHRKRQATIILLMRCCLKHQWTPTPHLSCCHNLAEVVVVAVVTAAVAVSATATCLLVACPVQRFRWACLHVYKAHPLKATVLPIHTCCHRIFTITTVNHNNLAHNSPPSVRPTTQQPVLCLLF